MRRLLTLRRGKGPREESKEVLGATHVEADKHINGTGGTPEELSKSIQALGDEVKKFEAERSKLETEETKRGRER